MKLLLVAPASGPWRRIGRQRWFNGRTFRFSMLSLLRVAASSPPDVDVRLVDEQVENVPFDPDVDLVGVTCMTALAPRAYEIADAFRERGVPVVLGGMHPTFLSEEALRHADAVVAGEAEGVWARVLADVAAGRLGGVYRSDAPPDLADLPRPPRRLLAARRYGTVHAVQATRGCPHRCDFCAVSAFHGGRFRMRPVEDVLAEVAEIPERFFLFVDDNLTAEREWARHLLHGLASLGKQWVTQSTLEATEDDEIVELAAAAGCVGFFVGLETFSDRNLASARKGFHRVARYREAIRRLHARGIGVEAGIVFGFDGDDAGVFERTLAALDRLEVDAIQVSIRTPLPGTPAHEAMRDRIFDRNWAHYDFHHVVFEPSRMSAEALQAGHDWVTREFYRPWRIARRLAHWARRPRGLATARYALALNAAYFGRVARWRIRGWNPAREMPAPAFERTGRRTPARVAALPSS